jgi:hypothetical protein
MAGNKPVSTEQQNLLDITRHKVDVLGHLNKRISRLVWPEGFKLEEVDRVFPDITDLNVVPRRSLTFDTETAGVSVFRAEGIEQLVGSAIMAFFRDKGGAFKEKFIGIDPFSSCPVNTESHYVGTGSLLNVHDPLYLCVTADPMSKLSILDAGLEMNLENFHAVMDLMGSVISTGIPVAWVDNRYPVRLEPAAGAGGDLLDPSRVD